MSSVNVYFRFCLTFIIFAYLSKINHLVNTQICKFYTEFKDLLKSKKNHAILKLNLEEEIYPFKVHKLKKSFNFKLSIDGQINLNKKNTKKKKILRR